MSPHLLYIYLFIAAASAASSAQPHSSDAVPSDSNLNRRQSLEAVIDPSVDENSLIVRYPFYDVTFRDATNTQWIDIRTIGAQLSISDKDDAYTSRSLNFDFPFHDNLESTVYINTNGFIAFLAADCQIGGQSSFCNWQSPGNWYVRYISPLTTDLDPSRGSSNALYFHQDTDSETGLRRCIIQWSDVSLWQPTANSNDHELEFQIILLEDGTIILNYHHMSIDPTEVTGSLNYPLTIGIKDNRYTSNNQLVTYTQLDLDLDTIAGFAGIADDNLANSASNGFYTAAWNDTSVLFSPLPACSTATNCSECIALTDLQRGDSDRHQCGWCESEGICTDTLTREYKDLPTECQSTSTLINDLASCSSSSSSSSSSSGSTAGDNSGDGSDNSNSQSAICAALATVPNEVSGANTPVCSQCLATTGCLHCQTPSASIQNCMSAQDTNLLAACRESSISATIVSDVELCQDYDAPSSSSSSSFLSSSSSSSSTYYSSTGVSSSASSTTLYSSSSTGAGPTYANLVSTIPDAPGAVLSMYVDVEGFFTSATIRLLLRSDLENLIGIDSRHVVVSITSDHAASLISGKHHRVSSLFSFVSSVSSSPIIPSSPSSSLSSSSLSSPSFDQRRPTPQIAYYDRYAVTIFMFDNTDFSYPDSVGYIPIQDFIDAFNQTIVDQAISNNGDDDDDDDEDDDGNDPLTVLPGIVYSSVSIAKNQMQTIYLCTDGNYVAAPEYCVSNAQQEASENMIIYTNDDNYINDDGNSELSYKIGYVILFGIVVFILAVLFLYCIIRNHVAGKCWWNTFQYDNVDTSERERGSDGRRRGRGRYPGQASLNRSLTQVHPQINHHTPTANPQDEDHHHHDFHVQAVGQDPTNDDDMFVYNNNTIAPRINATDDANDDSVAFVETSPSPGESSSIVLTGIVHNGQIVCHSSSHPLPPLRIPRETSGSGRNRQSNISRYTNHSSDRNHNRNLHHHHHHHSNNSSSGSSHVELQTLSLSSAESGLPTRPERVRRKSSFRSFPSHSSNMSHGSTLSVHSQPLSYQSRSSISGVLTDADEGDAELTDNEDEKSPNGARHAEMRRFHVDNLPGVSPRTPVPMPKQFVYPAELNPSNRDASDMSEASSFESSAEGNNPNITQYNTMTTQYKNNSIQHLNDRQNIEPV